jgi:hypothetical protein
MAFEKKLPQDVAGQRVGELVASVEVALNGERADLGTAMLATLLRNSGEVEGV